MGFTLAPWAQFHRAAKHKNLLDKNMITNMKSHGNLVGSPVFIKEESSF